MSDLNVQTCEMRCDCVATCTTIYVSRYNHLYLQLIELTLLTYLRLYLSSLYLYLSAVLEEEGLGPENKADLHYLCIVLLYFELALFIVTHIVLYV